MAREALAHYNVVGSFPSMEGAREAMTSIGRAGLEAGKVSLQGQQANEAESDTDTAERDRGAVDEVGKRAGLGVVAGGVVGGAVGLMAGAAAFGAPDLAAAAAGAAAGAAVAGVTSGVASIDLSDDWELTYDSGGEGAAVVMIRADSEEEAGKAAELLHAAHADNVRCFDSQGRPVAA